VTRIDRLGRSVRELLDLIDRIDKAGAKFRSVGDPLLQLLPDAVVPSKEELAAYFNVKALPRHGGYVNLNPRRVARATTGVPMWQEPGRLEGWGCSYHFHSCMNRRRVRWSG
jgi:Resolvase, N terminal domain